MRDSIKNLEEFILLMGQSEIGIGDVVDSFWSDREDLESRVVELTMLIEINKRERGKLRKREQRMERRKLADECWSLFVERKKLKTKLKGRREKVKLAFNQLFLKEKVKMADGRYPFRHDLALSFTELKARAISQCERSIEETRRMIEGKEASIINCWYFNLQDYLDSYKHTEILKRSEMSPLLKMAYKPKVELTCVGSGLAMDVFPTRIVKKKYSKQSALMVNNN